MKASVELGQRRRSWKRATVSDNFVIAPYIDIGTLSAITGYEGTDGPHQRSS